MSLKIDTDFPGGNIFIEDINGFDITIAKDFRNTEGSWFYWAFRGTFDEPGTYRFTFSNGMACGARGPAVSYDNGITWEWLGADCVENGPSRWDVFSYTYDGTRGNQVIFCFCIQYQLIHLEAFLKQHQGSPYLTTSILAHTRKNRPVERIRICDGSPEGKKHIVLTARHHCCETMASYVLEGVMAGALADTDDGRLIRSRYVIDVIPFVDKDGVVDGDQGKNRKPHDHARDYGSGHNLYPEIAAIQDLILENKPWLIWDFHCPWIREDCNETIYFPGPADKEKEAKMLKLSRLLEQEAPAEAPHYTKDNILFGTGWNTNANYKNGKTMGMWASGYDFVEYVAALEVSYANAREITLTPDSCRKLGVAAARCITLLD